MEQIGAPAFPQFGRQAKVWLSGRRLPAEPGPYEIGAQFNRARSISEHEFQRRLDLTGRVSLATDDAELRVTEGHTGISEADMVRHVEQLSAELEIMTYLGGSPQSTPR